MGGGWWVEIVPSENGGVFNELMNCSTWGHAQHLMWQQMYVVIMYPQTNADKSETYVLAHVFVFGDQIHSFYLAFTPFRFI